jgi:hypothetical protein
MDEAIQPIERITRLDCRSAHNRRWRKLRRNMHFFSISPEPERGERGGRLCRLGRFMGRL